MRRAIFSVDEALWFEGYHNPDVRWNGFAVPHFTIETVRRMAEYFDETGSADPTLEVERIEIVESEGEEPQVSLLTPYGVEAVSSTLTPYGRLYAVGACSWTWSQWRLPTAVLLRPDGTAESRPPAKVTYTLEELQEAVGGYIEILTLPYGRLMIVNEEGYLRGLPFNPQASAEAGRPILGPVLVVDGTLLE